ncbi:multiple C2 and transmembrane domain-containing protein 2 [Etheostoma spectabile]|uniref:multiple C2 and transmembrane domain-containing protein 2 n=1 Tax=Etheostoma spectabile TaxID=54343 RepID=UPI0013AECFE4|nr:multiple C2 and transmembrane domain-containing protein 2 [Etheostoma spectabile]
MDVKKKNFLENFRLKTKLVNLKKPGKKAFGKRGKKLAYRRSISVPDLRFVPAETVCTDSVLVSTPSDAFSLSNSRGESDTDSVASGSVVDGPLFPESRLKVPIDRTAVALNRISSTVGTQNLHEENEQAHKTAMGNAPEFTFDPILKPRSVFNNAPPTSPDIVGRGNLSGEDTPVAIVPNVAAVLARASSMGEQMKPYTEKRITAFEHRESSPEKGTPPPTRANGQGTSLESADGTSSPPSCGSPSEEQVNMPWTTDSEDLDRELCSLALTEDALLEEAQPGEELEETTEASSGPSYFFDENMQDPPENYPFMTAGPDVEALEPCQRYLLNINLKQGRNLVIRDKRSGTSDPYVKFKLEGKQFYKCKVVYKSLNPRWNESFSHPLRDREHVVEVRVYDKNRTADEFMGSSTISLKHLQLYKTYEMELRLDDPKSKEDDMGVILVDVCLMFRDATIKRSPRWRPRKNKQNQAALSPRPAETQRNQLKNQIWTGVLGITLVEGQDLPQYGRGDIYVRFRLGDQKYKSKNLCIQANPQWREQFDFNQFEDNQEPLQVEVYSKRGRKCEESWGLFEIDLLRLPLNERQLYTHVLDPGKGRLVFLVTLRPCWGVSISDIETAALENPDERDTVVEKFSLKNSHKCVGEVGLLQVKVVKANDLPATDLNGKSNPFCVVELGNSKLQTHTIYKTLNPEWNKAFTFPIKDIHDVIELTLLDENGDKAPNFLGKLAIPLLNVQNGQEICLFLKKEDLGGTSKGTITLILEVIYNKVRAGIRTFQPKETTLMEENVKFSKKVLARNIYRVRKISTAVLYTLQYIKSCFQWESTQRSLIAFLESGKKGLMDKIHMVQEVVLAVQNVLEEIANTGERIKNIFNWSVPFVSCLACLVLFVATALLYFIPPRYIVLIWGVNKFTKKLRDPYTIDNNETLNFLKRVPSDVQKVQHSALRAPTSQNQPRKKR